MAFTELKSSGAPGADLPCACFDVALLQHCTAAQLAAALMISNLISRVDVPIKALHSASLVRICVRQSYHV